MIKQMEHQQCKQAAFAGDNPSNASQTYIDEVTIESYYKELTTYREGTDKLNATAKNLAGFVRSVQENGGYYLARYEASYGNGNSVADWKPLSKISTGTPRTNSSTALTQGMLWNYVTELDTSKICQNMYANDNTVGVESDLTNSYAWDTAIVFIQEMENNNYANKTDKNGTLRNTGSTGDEGCNIFDMAANVLEWTTEYSTSVSGTQASPCIYRGGACNTGNYFTASRTDDDATDSYSDAGFRVILYVKQR